ncbi:MAG: SH3 domain-containing protein [Anaerolineae bacterium]|nr:SH3 domain-containing protein [Anaerolineae bacterium]
MKAAGQDQINVRSGPDSTVYPVIGVLLVGQEMPAKGITQGGDWVLIQYPGVQGGEGWVYSTYVDLIGGNVPIVQPPSTPTPQYTPTIDPTLAAQFAFTTEPTRLPTYTPAPPVVIPTFEDVKPVTLVDIGVPMGLIIVVVGIVGILLALVAFIQRR